MNRLFISIDCKKTQSSLLDVLYIFSHQ